MSNQSLKEFIKRIQKVVPKSDEEEPLLLIEFESDHHQGFQSRIAVYDFLDGKNVKYKYVDGDVLSFGNWNIRSDDYIVLNLVRPTSLLISPSKRSLGLLQIGKRHDH